MLTAHQAKEVSNNGLNFLKEIEDKIMTDALKGNTVTLFRFPKVGDTKNLMSNCDNWIEEYCREYPIFNNMYSTTYQNLVYCDYEVVVSLAEDHVNNKVSLVYYIGWGDIPLNEQIEKILSTPTKAY